MILFITLFFLKLVHLPMSESDVNSKEPGNFFGIVQCMFALGDNNPVVIVKHTNLTCSVRPK